MKCLLLAFHSSRHRRLCRATAPSFWHQYTYSWKAFSSNGLPVKSFCIHWNDFYQWHFGQYCARKANLSRTVKTGEILWHMLKSSKNIQPEVFPYGFKHATHNGNGQLLRIALPAGYVLSFMVAMLLQWSIFFHILHHSCISLGRLHTTASERQEEESPTNRYLSQLAQCPRYGYFSLVDGIFGNVLQIELVRFVCVRNRFGGQPILIFFSLDQCRNGFHGAFWCML